MTQTKDDPTVPINEGSKESHVNDVWQRRTHEVRYDSGNACNDPRYVS